jgi:predicted RNase H-like HicB family nuclease
MASHYPIVVEQTDEDFWAYVPDLPGCIATGETIEELGRNVQEAIKIHVDCLVERGQPVPVPNSAQMLQHSAA